jgi:3-hydroxyisobutyrate dehydrogenase
MASVAFAGLGKMGLPMAGRVLRAGHSLRVYNRTPQKAEPLLREGAVLAPTPREACAGASAVISMTADDASSRAVWLGSEGVLAADLPRGSFAVECSTLSHGWSLELAAQAAKRGLRYIDAPVTGLPDDAAGGALTLLVGAQQDDLQEALPLLSAFADRIIRFGLPGTGTAYKLIVNLMGAVQIASAAEGLALAERAGLDRRTFADAIATSQASSPQVVRNTRRMVEDDHARNVVFTPQLRLKDVEYALRLARELNIGAPFGEVARGHLQRLCALSPEMVNESKIVCVARAQPPGGDEDAKE